MAHEIQTRKNENGELRFRVWSTISDGYLTREMTEVEIREWILKKAVCEAIEQHFNEIDNRIERAITIGTSSLMGITRNQNAPWDKERE